MTDVERMKLGPDLPVMITRGELLQVAAKMVLAYTEDDYEMEVSLFLLPSGEDEKREHVPLSFVADELDLHNLAGPYFAKLTGYPRFKPEFDERLENLKDMGNEVRAEIFIDDAPPQTNNLTGLMAVFMQPREG